jgi:peptide/nickel transport system permease protein
MREGWNLLLRAGAALVGLLALGALGAPWLAPYDPADQADPASASHRPPLTRLRAVRTVDGGWLLADRARRQGAVLEIERRGEISTLPLERVANLSADGVADSRFFLLGSDRLGRDVSSRLLYGARVSLAVGVLALLLALTLGLAVGAVAGAAGGAVDLLLMRAVDAMLAFPTLLLALTAAALLRSSPLTLVLILGGTAWMSVARLVRGEILAIKERDFVLAARAAGARPWSILWRHLLPNALTPVIVDASLRIGDLILVEAALSFLGLGVQPPTPSWGSMIADGRDALSTAWWVAVFPGLAIALAVMGFNLVGDGLRDRYDPHLQRARP